MLLGAATPTDAPPGGAITLIEIALVVFVVVFLAIVLRVVLARRGRYDAASRIPLHEDRVLTPRDSGDTAPGGPERA
jgi:cbb3-type cytochrome oxidase subunit 3